MTRGCDGDWGQAEAALVHQQRGQRGPGDMWGVASDLGAETCGSCEEREGGVRVVEIRLGRTRGEEGGVARAGPWSR